MEKLFISYKQALKLKKLGFDEECLNIWFVREKEISFKIGFLELKNSDLGINSNYISAPLWQQAFDFLLDKVNRGIGFDEYILEIPNYKLFFRDAHDKKELERGKEGCFDKLIKILEK